MAGDASARPDAPKKSARAGEQDRDDVKAARPAWPERVEGVAAEDLVFLDETGASTAMHRTRGDAPVGQRLAGDAPHDHWKVVTFVGALTARGLVAPWTQAEPMTGEVFLADVE